MGSYEAKAEYGNPGNGRLKMRMGRGQKQGGAAAEAAHS